MSQPLSQTGRSGHPRRILLLIVVLVVLTGAAVGVYLLLRKRPAEPVLPQPGSPEYQDFVSAFDIGVAALTSVPEVHEQNERAKTKLTRAIELVPQEPAAWANRGLFYLRMTNTAVDPQAKLNYLKAAAEDLDKAHTLAPDNSDIEMLRGFLEKVQGHSAEAMAHFRSAMDLNRQNVRVRYALARELEEQGGENKGAEIQPLLDDIQQLRPNNLHLLVERARLAVERADMAALRSLVGQLGKHSAYWPPDVLAQYRSLQETTDAGNVGQALVAARQLQNVLVRVPAFLQSRADLEAPFPQMSVPLEHFVRLPSPSPTPAPPDTELSFAGEPLPVQGQVGQERWHAAVPVWLTGEGKPAVFLANGHEVRWADAAGVVLPFPGGPRAAAPSADAVLPLDWNNDFRMDLFLAGAGGVRFFQQDADGKFTDVTARTTLDASITGADCAGAWAVDIDLDGDLDIVLGLRSGQPVVLRNNRDGIWRVLKPFAGVSDVRAFVWADLDHDGAADAALLDARGQLHVFMNERAGRFRPRPLPEEVGKLAAVAVADINSDGILDLVALRQDGTILRISSHAYEHDGAGQAWDLEEIARWPEAADARPDGLTRLYLADLDNNGGLDLVVSRPAGGRVWLSDAQGKLQALNIPLKERVFSAADLTGSGRLDLLALSEAGQPVRLANRGAKNYHWQVIRPQANRNIVGDGRLNSFGIGGEMEIRSGLLVQKQAIAGPVVHFGLGEHAGTDVVRIVWPNGVPQTEFELKADQAVAAVERLKGSCPFVFTHDGRGMQFVTDFLWRSPLGLRINAQDTAGVMQTEDWIKIRGDQLAARDGFYDVRVTAELWETHFFDYVALVAVDHPAGTEIFVDERFAIPQPPLQVYLTGPPQPIKRAWDDRGQDVTDILRARDGLYLDTFGRGAFQGVTRDHWVEIDLGEDDQVTSWQVDKAMACPLWLIAQGWTHPTDSSINMAIGQGRHEPPRGLVLEVPDGKGGWVVARPDLGFPAGKNKTILINLDGVFRPGTLRRLRLRTNLEVYWDWIAYAAGLDAAALRQQRLTPAVAELRFRGFSRIDQANASSPELPVYNDIAGTRQRWRDLIGYHTRFGDVRQLLAKVDDRYVIMNAGDELALRFPALPPPRKGFVRDFVLIGDGWVKDGDFNTAFSKTVLPLPAHDRPAYNTPPTRLEDDRVYQRHPRDWQEYHIRYVTPWEFNRGLWRTWSPSASDAALEQPLRPWGPATR